MKNLIKSLYLIILVLISTNTIHAEIDLSKNPIYAQIIKNKPRIDKKYAFKLSNVIFKVLSKKDKDGSKLYQFDKKIFIAILMQESGYVLKANNCTTGVTPIVGDDYSIGYEKATVCSDFGISQIYINTIERYDFDIALLLSDLEYSVEAGARVLEDVRKHFGAKEKDWYTRYNCGYKTTTRRSTCQTYKRLVSRYIH